NGSPPGVRVFERESGIKESEWFPALWLRWGDALQEAGFSRNKMVQAVGDEVLLKQYALLAQKLSRLPLQGELIRESKANQTFPSEKSYRRCGGKDNLIRAVAAFCGARMPSQTWPPCVKFGAQQAQRQKKKNTVHLQSPE